MAKSVVAIGAGMPGFVTVKTMVQLFYFVISLIFGCFFYSRFLQLETRISFLDVLSCCLSVLKVEVVYIAEGWRAYLSAYLSVMFLATYHQVLQKDLDDYCPYSSLIIFI